MAAFTDCPHTLHDEIIIVRLIEKNLTSLDLNDGDLTRLCLEAYEKKEALKFKLTEGVTVYTYLFILDIIHLLLLNFNSKIRREIKFSLVI